MCARRADWREGHAKGARHLSRGEIELEIEEQVPDVQTSNHLLLRWRKPIRARGRELAENGLQECPLDSRRISRVERSGTADDELTLCHPEQSEGPHKHDHTAQVENVSAP